MQYWIQKNGQGAIWYDHKYGNWKIAEKSSIGKSNIYSFFSYSADNLFGPHGVTKWKYRKDGNKKLYFDNNSYIKVQIAGTKHI